MREAQNKVREFKLAMGQGEHVGEYPNIPSEPTRRLAAKLILEEAREAIESLGFHVVELERDEKRYLDILPHDKELKLSEIAKECGDLHYVTFWAEDACSLPADITFDAVAANNMTKVGGPKCPDTGKQLKGPNYKKLDMARVLEENCVT